MPWSGSTFTRTNGTYTGSTVWNSDRLAGIDIIDTRHDTHDQDLATGINNCLTKDGQNAATADLPMATYKHTGVGNGTARNHYSAIGQIQDSLGVPYFGTTGGTSTALTLTPSPAITAYTTGMRFCFKLHTDIGLHPTMNINGVGANSLTHQVSGGLFFTGSLKSGTFLECVYNGTNFTVLNFFDVGTWTPSYGATGSMTYTSVTTNNAWFYVSGKVCHYALSATGTTGGTAHLGVTFSLPFQAASGSFCIGSGYNFMNPGQYQVYVDQQSVTTAQIYVYDLRVWNLASGVQFRVNGSYNIG